MNHIITTPGRLAPLIPTIESLVASRGDRYELEDTVLRAGGYAWDIGTDAAPLHAHIAAIAQAEADAEAERIAHPPAPTPQEIWWGKLAGRITDATTDIEIDANEAVRNLLTGQLVMITTAINFGLITAATPQDIWDADGVKHTLPAAELIALILRHGAAWQSMFAEFAP